jgi:hypothetical protein
MKTVLLNSLKFLLLFLAFNTFAENNDLPRFVTIKSNEVNSRVGPGLQYPVSLVFINKGEPVEVIAEFNNWRQIRDVEGEISWVHLSLLSRKRSVIIASALPVSMFSTPFSNSGVIANIFPNVRCEFLNYCNNELCKINCNSNKGWVKRDCLWGVHQREFQKNNQFMLYIKSIF